MNSDPPITNINHTNLTCTLLMLTILNTYDVFLQKLRQLVQKLLDRVQAELKLTSVSIPAIGTGWLKFPEDLVAKAMFEEAMTFSSKHGASLKIKQYNVVVCSGNTKAVDILKEQFQVFSNKKIINEPKVPKTTRSKSKTPHVFRKSSAKDKGEKFEDETNGVEVEIIHGNIVEESTDAIGFLVFEDIEQGKECYLTHRPFFTQWSVVSKVFNLIGVQGKNLKNILDHFVNN